MINACQILITLVENVILIFKSTPKRKLIWVLLWTCWNLRADMLSKRKGKKILWLPPILIENGALSKPVNGLLSEFLNHRSYCSNAEATWERNQSTTKMASSVWIIKIRRENSRKKYLHNSVDSKSSASKPACVIILLLWYISWGFFKTFVIFPSTISAPDAAIINHDFFPIQNILQNTRRGPKGSEKLHSWKLKNVSEISRALISFATR